MKFGKTTRKYTLEQITEIYNEYKQGILSIKELDKKYKSDLWYQFKMHKLPPMQKGFFRDKNRLRFYKNEVIYNFSEISNETEAYILGFIYSDGYITRGDKLGITIIKSDTILLEKIKNYICPLKNLRPKGKNAVEFYLSEPTLYSNLLKWGVQERKSYKLNTLPKLSKELMRHFIRGYFDGDGTVFFDKNLLRAFIYSVCQPILLEMEKILNEEGILTKIYVHLRKGKICKVPQGTSICTQDMYRLCPIKRPSLYKFYQFLYKDHTICLERKRNKFEQYFEKEINEDNQWLMKNI